MKTPQLNHVLRAVDSITGSNHSFLLIGSQAILAHIDPDWFPELEDSDALFVSSEIDVAVLDGDEETRSEIATQIEGALGELSRFDQEFGYHADGVSIHTAILAKGWEKRLKPYFTEGLRADTFWALSYQDLLVSKLMAGREKDLEFVRCMCAAQPAHPGLADIQDLIESLPPEHDDLKPLAMARWDAMRHAITLKPKTPHSRP